jgi:ATPase subunit of ABC transporter with duplicated ATPase domains
MCTAVLMEHVYMLYCIACYCYYNATTCSILGVIGANGVGKSTLLKMIAGKLQPDEGTLEVGETVQCMYVDQNREGLDDASLTVYQAITDGADEIDLGKRKVNKQSTIMITSCSCTLQ